MAPLFVFMTVAAILRLLGALGVEQLASWRFAGRIGLAVTFLFTGATHFSSMRHDYAAMIPPPLTGSLWLISLTGMLEIVGAIGLLVPRRQRVAAICLIVLLVALFPTNVYAALNGVPFRGQPPTQLGLRALLQLFFIWSVWWTSIRNRARSGRGVAG
jgi:uncharacterized membrane protein